MRVEGFICERCKRSFIAKPGEPAPEDTTVRVTYSGNKTLGALGHVALEMRVCESCVVALDKRVKDFKQYTRPGRKPRAREENNG